MGLCEKYMKRLSKLNKARKLRAEIRDNGFYKWTFLKIKKYENWNWFIDYWNNPHRELITDKYREILVEHSHLLDEWIPVVWEHKDLVPLIENGDIKLTYSEAPILKELWSKNKQDKYIDNAISIGYIQPYSDYGDFEKAIEEKLGQIHSVDKSLRDAINNYEIPKDYNPTICNQRYLGQRNRNGDEAWACKNLCSQLLGDDKNNLIRDKNQLKMVAESYPDYNFGEIISLDISTNRLHQLRSYSGDKLTKYLKDNAKIESIGWHIVGKDSGWIINENDIKFREDVLKLLIGKKLVISFNGDNFDIPILKNYGIDIEKDYEHYDIYTSIYFHQYIRLSLDGFSKLNNLPSKNVKKGTRLDKAIAAKDDAKLTSALFTLLTKLGLKYSEDADKQTLITSIVDGIRCILNNNKLFDCDRTENIYQFLLEHGWRD